ncbi:MAG: hypothetical protein H3C31_09720 [Brumimicrobium sp.]|nr:hypothetical protein [Brumimicrobium sp.]MCO5269934.1 hypothetical protein [Brumimicrobium sp.]
MKDVEKSELVEQAFEFWFNGQEHIRSPFPSYIHNELKQRAIIRFNQWLDGLKDDLKDEINDEIVAEKFEEILFEEAHKLVLTEDEKNTILYPFLPRVGDHLNDYEGKKSEIIDRHILAEKDVTYLKVKCKRIEDDNIWETSFELPV